MNWHVLIMHCPGCKCIVKVDEVSFRADRMVRIEGVCPGCHRRLYLEETWEQALPKEERPRVDFDLEHWNPQGRPS